MVHYAIFVQNHPAGSFSHSSVGYNIKKIKILITSLEFLKAPKDKPQFPVQNSIAKLHACIYYKFHKQPNKHYDIDMISYLMSAQCAHAIPNRQLQIYKALHYILSSGHKLLRES